MKRRIIAAPVSILLAASLVLSLPVTVRAETWQETADSYDALFEMMGAENYNRLLEKGTIEIAPLAYMRGRTLDDSFIILDEAQNATPEQMKMFLTRLGFNSKAVITGDLTQTDLPFGQKSGLAIATNILTDIDDIGIHTFTERDVVRHKLVAKIILAYDKYEKKLSEQQSKNEKSKAYDIFFKLAGASSHNLRAKNTCTQSGRSNT